MVKMVGWVKMVKTGWTVFRANNVSGSSEAYIPTLDLKTLMLPFGVQIAKGSTEKMVLRIRDDCSAVDQFDCIAYGFDRI